MVRLADMPETIEHLAAVKARLVRAAQLVTLPLVLSVTPAAQAGETFDSAWAVTDMRLDLSFESLVIDDLDQPALQTDSTSPSTGTSTADPSAPTTPASNTEPDTSPGFGQAGSTFLTIGGLWAFDLDKDHDLNLHVAWSKFVADDLEFAIEGAGWYFSQVGDDTAGLSASMVLRWHTFHAHDYSWSVFGDFGIGVLGSFDNVPDGGTGFNFLPRAGAGVTGALHDAIDGVARGSRWQVGVRWHHISNGRIEGDERNPSRDSVALYAAIILPF